MSTVVHKEIFDYVLNSGGHETKSILFHALNFQPNVILYCVSFCFLDNFHWHRNVLEDNGDKTNLVGTKDKFD